MNAEKKKEIVQVIKQITEGHPDKKDKIVKLVEDICGESLSVFDPKPGEIYRIKFGSEEQDVIDVIVVKSYPRTMIGDKVYFLIGLGGSFEPYSNPSYTKEELISHFESFGYVKVGHISKVYDYE